MPPPRWYTGEEYGLLGPEQDLCHGPKGTCTNAVIVEGGSTESYRRRVEVLRESLAEVGLEVAKEQD